MGAATGRGRSATADARARRSAVRPQAVRTIAPAKVNLYLGVRAGVDEDGYHRVTSVMCALRLCDEVRVRVASEPGITVACDPDPVGGDPRRNLAYRAADDLAKALGVQPRLHIQVSKRVPAQAGLGGGSSDAAAVLRCLRALWDGVDERLVGRVARGLGADVPFFLHDQPCLLEGRGDVACERFPFLDVPLVLARPDRGVPTAAAYRAFDELGPALPDVGPLCDALRAADAPRVLDALQNNLQPAACAVEPAVGETLALLRTVPDAAARPLLCGSGSACALFVRDDDQARRVADALAARGLWACATRTCAGPWGGVVACDDDVRPEA